MELKKNRILILGAGLAGSDAAYFLAEKGLEVVLVEGKAVERNPAQKMTTYAELVCTNSLKSKQKSSAHGILKHEMEGLGSLILKKGNDCSVPAGDALAVDREQFSKEITNVLTNHSNITIVEMDATNPLEIADKYGCYFIIVATGPLTSKKLEDWITENISVDDFYFYDAIAPVVDADSLDYTKLYYKDRHKKISDEEGVLADYLNAPFSKQEYEIFINELVLAEKVPAQNFEKYQFFESCLPVDIMAERGVDTARFSCMKPIGLEKENGERPYAVVQLRKENLLGSAFNLVGFQTRLTYKEQVRIFKTIPGFENASFIHLGSVHRNSFLNSKKLLNFDLSCKALERIHFAGQITGVEGYTESASIGLYVASQIYRKIEKLEVIRWPVQTGIGALVNYIMTNPKPVPSSINFGLLPSVQLTREQKKKRSEIKKIKKELVANKAHEYFNKFKQEHFFWERD